MGCQLKVDQGNGNCCEKKMMLMLQTLAHHHLLETSAIVSSHSIPLCPDQLFLDHPVSTTTDLQTVQNPSSPMSHRTKHIQHSPACNLAWLMKRGWFLCDAQRINNMNWVRMQLEQKETNVLRLRSRIIQYIWEAEAYFGQACTSKEHWHSIPARVGRSPLDNLDSIVSQEVVQLHLTCITKHTAGQSKRLVTASNFTDCFIEMNQEILALTNAIMPTHLSASSHRQ